MSLADKMLLAQKQVQELSPPKSRVWDVFRNWFLIKRPFIGHSKGLLDNKNEGDFVSVGAVGEHDLLTRLVEHVTARIVAVSVA